VTTRSAFVVVILDRINRTNSMDKISTRFVLILYIL
jgi:hypothetical protein